MTSQDSSRMDGTTTVHVTLVILQNGNSTPGSDETVPAHDHHAEPRTRQQHAAADPAERSPTDG
jgi:hypothetical protein